MLFNSFPFLFVFLPVAVAGYFAATLVRRRLAAVWLAVASIAFYYWWSPAYTILLGVSLTFNYLCSRVISSLQSRPAWQTAVLTLGVATNLFVLFYYKYFFPLLGFLGDIGVATQPETTRLALPLGISFFTFTQIGYLVDCKAGLANDRNPLSYVLFVAFFPHLIAGPIVHHREMMPQFSAPESDRLDIGNILVGCNIFVIGLAKKVLIADHLSEFVGAGFGTPTGQAFAAAWLLVLSYALQLYFDFSGYSDMAVGLARIFGIRFPANFDSPFKARSIIEFWQRWHMTLTRYLSYYLFNPMAVGIARRRAAKGKSISRRATETFSGFSAMVALPTFYTMTLAGVWHGAGLQYLVFGLLHAVYLTSNHAFRTFGPRLPQASPWHPVAAACKVLATFCAVLVALVFFRAASLGDAIELLKGMLGMNGMTSELLAPARTGADAAPGSLTSKTVVVLIAAAMITWGLPNTNEIFSAYSPVLTKIREASPPALRWRPSSAWGIAFGLLAALALLFLAGTTEFLYFQF